MGKLGKKARKFAKKNLQSVLRQRRKTKATFKKRPSRKNKQDGVQKQVVDTEELSNARDVDNKVSMSTSLDAVFVEDDCDIVSDASDSDGYLSEDSSFVNLLESENDGKLEENGDKVALSVHHQKIHEELSLQKKKLDKLKKKDPNFVEFLESYNEGEILENDEMYSDEDEASEHLMQLGFSSTDKGRLLTSSVIDLWSKLVMEEHNESALISLLNAYRAACHLGTESTRLIDAASCPRIQNIDTFCNIYTFMLQEADNIFRCLLKIPSSNCKKETIMELKNTSRWKKVKPMVKSYLRSTLFLLRQVADSEILAFSITRLRASIVFFAAFPSLLSRLIKIIIPLWATGAGTLSSSSFSIIRDVVSLFGSSYFDICLIRIYKAYIAQCRNVEIVDAKHIEFLRDSFVELCSLDVENSCSKALVSVQQLAYILQLALQKEKKEPIKKICSWQYAQCIDVWVHFISANVRDYDIQFLLYTTIQLINGVIHLFPGPRYLPLRVRCIQWLTKLSSSSGIFIPVASLVLDMLEYKIGKEGGRSRKTVDLTSNLKLPKFWVKSQNFLEQCVYSAIELLVSHFIQWSYHISFPELATIPLIRLRKFHENTSVESLRRAVKRLIDQVELNVEFVQKKRDDIDFSPKDHESVDQFLQLEKGGVNTPFMQYYKSVTEKAAAKNLSTSPPEQKRLKRKKSEVPENPTKVGVNIDPARSHCMGKKRRAVEV